LTFISESNHGRSVRELLKRHRVDTWRIQWQEWKVPERDRWNLRRIRGDYKSMAAALGQARRAGAERVVFCSTTNMSLLALKAEMTLNPVDCPVLTIFHAELSNILPGRHVRWQERAFELKHILRLRQPRNLRFVALGEPILQELIQQMPSQRSLWSSIDHPYLFAPGASAPPLREVQRLRFGFIGATQKGFGAFLELARDIRSEFPEAVFELVGFVNSPVPSNASDLVDGLGEMPLAREEFEARMRRLTYCVFLSDPREYQLRASGTFFDAISFLKPILGLRIPYLEYYSQRYGEFGVLTEGYSELVSVIRSVLQSFPRERYDMQRRTLCHLQDRMNPMAVGSQLAAIGAK